MTAFNSRLALFTHILQKKQQQQKQVNFNITMLELYFTFVSFDKFVKFIWPENGKCWPFFMKNNLNPLAFCLFANSSKANLLRLVNSIYLLRKISH